MICFDEVKVEHATNHKLHMDGPLSCYKKIPDKALKKAKMNNSR